MSKGQDHSADENLPDPPKIKDDPVSPDPPAPVVPLAVKPDVRGVLRELTAIVAALVSAVPSGHSLGVRIDALRADMEKL